MYGKTVITINLNIVDIENYIVGCLCIDEKALQEICVYVTEEDFQNNTAKTVFNASIRLASKQKPIDPNSIISEARLMKQDIPESYLSECMRTTPTASNASEYAKRLHEIAEMNRLGDVLEAVSIDLHNGTVSLEDAKEKAKDALQRVCFSDDGIVTAEQALQSCLNELEEINSGTYKPIRTGLKGIDRFFYSGLKRGALYIIGARPGCGKTTLALNIAEKIAESHRRVLYITLEMTVAELTRIRLQIRGKIQGEDIQRPHGSEVSEKIKRASNEIRRFPIDFNKSFGLSLPYISKLCSSKKPDVIIVDHLQLVSSISGKTQYEKITNISGQLKQLALEHDIPVICLSQLNRNSANSEPNMHDLRDSGAIEQDADAIMLLYIVTKPEEDDYSSPAILQLEMGKNRSGKSGKSLFNWYMNTGIIEDRYPNMKT